LNERRARTLMWLFAAAAAASLPLSLMFGSVAVDPVAALTGWLAPGDPSLPSAIVALRLPRAVTAIAVGGLLALSGALLQALLRNPLADPYVLGISGGAACAAMLAIAAGAGPLAVHGAGVLGALVTLAALFLLARRALFGTEHRSGDSASSSILLVGVMMASFAAAALSLVLSLAPAAQLRPMVFWLLGDLSGALDPIAAWISLAVLALCGWACARDARALNLMLRGDLQAFTQGVEVDRIRRRLVIRHRHAIAVLGDIDERSQPGGLELAAVLVVDLEVERVLEDDREEEPVVVEAPAAEHRLRDDRPELAHRLDDVLDEVVARLHRGHAA